MGRLIACFCCLIVALQLIIVGIVATGIALLPAVHGNASGSIEIHFHPEENAALSTEAPAKAGPAADLATTASSDADSVPVEFASIMASRAERGSLLKGTSLAASPEEEQAAIVSTLRQLTANEPLAVGPALDFQNEQIIESALVQSLALACAEQWNSLALDRQEQGDLAAADRYRELARQCVDLALESENPALPPTVAN